MRAWVVDEIKPGGRMELRDIAMPAARGDECLVRVEAAGVNFLDTLMMRGLYQVKPPLPFTPGVEIVGVVVERGPESPYAIGDRLCALIDQGGFAEFARAPQLASLKVPNDMPARDAVSLPSVYPTAFLALRDRARLEPAETVLVQAGAGGVGSAATQLAKRWDARVIATAGGAEKAALCRELGADVALDYNAGGFVESVRQATAGRGVDVVVDPVGGKVTLDSLRCLGWGGRTRCGRLRRRSDRGNSRQSASSEERGGSRRLLGGLPRSPPRDRRADIPGDFRPLFGGRRPAACPRRLFARRGRPRARGDRGSRDGGQGGDLDGRAAVIDPDRLLGLRFPEVRHAFTRRDTILYALGVGIGCDPLDPQQLRFVYEPDLVALPTMAVTLAYPGYSYRDLDTGLDHQRTVHASENVTIHATLPIEGEVVARPRVIGVIDKGRERGALVVSERDIRDTATGTLIATVRQTAMCRGDGGFSGAPQRKEGGAALPARAPDRALTLPTSPQAALIYRLSGDPNPLHVDPEFAHAAGFPRPVLHGLATMGLICHAAVREALDGAPERLRSMDCRFTVPVYPGDAIACGFWRTETDWMFRASVGDRPVAFGTILAAP